MLDALFLALGAAVGAVATWAVGRRRRREQVDAERRALLERDQARARATFLDRRLELRGTQLERATHERDDYAKIAATHRIEPRGFGKGQWVRKVWKDRRYSGHPRDNLEHLAADFEVFGQEHVLLTLDIDLLGGWKRLLGDEADAGKPTTPLSAGQALLFEGPADRVLQQLRTFMLDDDTGFVEPPPGRSAELGDEPGLDQGLDDHSVEAHEEHDQGLDLAAEDPAADEAADAGPPRWRDPDSPMIWRLTVDVLQGQAAPPEVEFVEVLRVQEKIVERIVERPVVRTVPPEVSSRLCAHTAEDLVTLIEAVLEVRELSYEQRVHAQKQALEGLLPGDEPKALRGE
ncbi:MAG: hypothetical protein H6712_06875 [Myxococcales bacterium]|nr:hypothetical protein [Myxococcales bacterium]MCB9713556.1 hypothetical protein [Myxococcales bacterium]